MHQKKCSADNFFLFISQNVERFIVAETNAMRMIDRDDNSWATDAIF